MFTLPKHQADSPGQVTLSLALLDELLGDPDRLADVYFTGYLLGMFDGEGSVARDQFASVAILGFDATISALYGGNTVAYLGGVSEIEAPEGLAMPPRIVSGLRIGGALGRDHERDKAARVRLLTGQHVGPVDEVRLSFGIASLKALADTELPANVRANLLTVAAFLTWMQGDPETAGIDINLAMMSDPDNKLAPLLLAVFQDHEPIWREAQAARNEVK